MEWELNKHQVGFLNLVNLCVNIIFESHDTFSINILPQEFKKIEAYIGSHSGRDGDKVAANGLEVSFTDNGTPVSPQSRLILECKKIYSHDLWSDNRMLGEEKPLTIEAQSDPSINQKNVIGNQAVTSLIPGFRIFAIDLIRVLIHFFSRPLQGCYSRLMC